MLVSQILKEKPKDGVVTVPPTMSMKEAVEMLSVQKIGAVIVSDDGVHPLGILSERDVVRELGKQGTKALEDTVGEHMTSELTTCTPSDRAIKVLQDMTDGRFRHMPVMEGDRMVGLVSIGDVVKARLEELSQQADALKNMIMGY